MDEQRMPSPLGHVVVDKRVSFAVAEHKGVVSGALALVLEGVVDELRHFLCPETES